MDYVYTLSSVSIKEYIKIQNFILYKICWDF